MDRLFAQGLSLFSGPVRFIYLKNPEVTKNAFLVGFSVPKRKIKHAVDRNSVKRLMRENFRLHQHKFQAINNITMMWLYTGNQIPDYKLIEKNMLKIINKFNSISSK